MTFHKLLGVCAFLAGLPALAPAASLDEPRAQFLHAEQALEQGRPAEARQMLDALGDYPLRPYLLAKILDRDPAGAGEITEFLERYGRTRYAAPLRKKWLDSLAQREAWSDFVRAYRDTGNSQTRCQYFWALHELNRRPEAFAGAARLWAAGEPAPAACDRLFAAWRATPEFTPDRVWERFGAVLNKDRVELAAALKSLLPAPDQASADFWLEVHAHPERVEQCAPWNPAEPIHGRIFAHGIVRLATREPLRAMTLWNLRRDGLRIDADTAARADRRLALALASKRYPQAAAYAADPADGEVRAARLRAALWRQDWPGVLIGWAHLDPAERKQAVWRYWRARALEALGATAEAGEIYRALASEREFYGFIAADRLGRDYPLSFGSAPVAEAELQRLLDSAPFQAIREFRALNRPGEARKEWVHSVESLPRPDLIAAAHLARQWDWPWLAIRAAAQAGLWDDLALRFPLAYAGPVMANARERRIDPAVVYGLIRRESAFDPEARSPVGALGLMQLMPRTGEEVARRLGDAWRSERGLLDPERNVRYGTAYFRGLLDRFGEHPALAAAAYNAGPSRVNRWLPIGGAMPADVWIEAIPFDETRRYVGAVLGHGAIYRQRLGVSPARISDFLPDIPPGHPAETPAAGPASAPWCPWPERRS